MNKKIAALFGFIIFIASGCLQKDQNITPKPKGYFRLAVPEHQYRKFDTLPPFTFEYAATAEVTVEPKSDNYWITIHYPQLNASLNMTYMPVKHSLRELMIEQEKFIEFHISQGKADDVEFSLVQDSALFGKIYNLKGKEVATPMQFWLSDSAHNWLRASLYFNFVPNNDSLQPIIDFLHEDMLHLINTFQWR
jgi:gliding motility-associated lipoprotein GldD